jgi:hypothetical protein
VCTVSNRNICPSTPTFSAGEFLLSADKTGMSGEAIPEQRAAVMILVDASWQDADGALQTIRARMETKSNAGACIRVNTEIEPGTTLQIQCFREEFTGVVKYAASTGKNIWSASSGIRRASWPPNCSCVCQYRRRGPASVPRPFGATLTVSGQRFVGTAVGAVPGELLAAHFASSVVVFGAGVFAIGVVWALLHLERPAAALGGVTLALVLLVSGARLACSGKSNTG